MSFKKISRECECIYVDFMQFLLRLKVFVISVLLGALVLLYLIAMLG